MAIQTFIDELRDQTAGCELTAFGDLSAKLVLRFSAPSSIRREELDRLCETAAKSFNILEAITTEESKLAEETTQSVVCFSSDSIQAFTRFGDGLNDVACATIKAGDDPNTALQNTQACAEKIAGVAE